MAVKEANMVRTFSGAGPFELKANVGESLLVKDILIEGPDLDYASIYIDKTTVGYFRVGTERGGHLGFKKEYDVGFSSLLSYLREKGIFAGYPVGEGQTMIIKLNTGSAYRCVVVYDKHDPGDITPTNENGTQADTYFFVNYGQPSSDPSTAGDILIDKSIIPAEFPAFPFGADVPARMEIDILGILFSPVGRTSGGGANKAISEFMKFIKERVVLFDDERQGILCQGIAPDSDGQQFGPGLSLIGGFSIVDRREPYIFPEAMTFAPGEELNVYVTTAVVAGAMNLRAKDLEVGLIMKVRKTG